MKYLTILVLASLAGCSLFDSDKANIRIEVTPDAEAYVLSDSTFASLNITNRSADTIYFGGCDKQQVEILDERTVITEFETISECYCICIMSVKPGETVQFTYGLFRLQQANLEAKSSRHIRVWPVFYDNTGLDNPLPRNLISVHHFEVNSK